MNNSILSKKFQKFSRDECIGSSGLYEVLAKEIAVDPELLNIAAHTREGQPVPNMLFGAVQYLLLTGANHSLRDFYQSIVAKPRSSDEAFPVFRSFCLEYRSAIIELLKNKLVQTNEVRRCAYLYPSFCFVYEQVKKPLALIEIGTSAGFQLLWDKYGYSYGTEKIYGNTQADIVLEAEIKGERFPELLQEAPPISHRIGLDLHINNVNQREDALWLKALIWPEHAERRALFEAAANQVKQTDVRLIEGDGVALLPELVEAIPEDVIICVFHTHVANQFSDSLKEKLLQEIKSIGSQRDIFHLYNNMYDRSLHLDYHVDREETRLIIGETEGHGRWFTWNL